MIEAKRILSSISAADSAPITTLQLRYPRFIHAEFMTHRMFSRNASSSRAVPTKKLLEEVRSDALRAAPIFWGKNQPGMQAAEELSSEPREYLRGGIPEPVFLSSDMERAHSQWRQAAKQAAANAESLLEIGAHKQIVNRILEPFTHINVVVTATEWDNFFGLRLDKGAQPEMQALAHAMWDAVHDGEPQELKRGQWHLPYVEAAYDLYPNARVTDIEDAIKVSVARCARVSYLSFETGKPSTIDEDLALYDKLVGAHPMHASPAEHQATPDWLVWSHFRAENIWQNRKRWGNFKGWIQYRKTLPGEDIAPLPNFNNPKGSYDANANIHRAAGRPS